MCIIDIIEEEKEMSKKLIRVEVTCPECGHGVGLETTDPKEAVKFLMNTLYGHTTHTGGTHQKFTGKEPSYRDTDSLWS